MSANNTNRELVFETSPENVGAGAGVGNGQNNDNNVTNTSNNTNSNHNVNIFNNNNNNVSDNTSNTNIIVEGGNDKNDEEEEADDGDIRASPKRNTLSPMRTQSPRKMSLFHKSDFEHSSLSPQKISIFQKSEEQNFITDLIQLSKEDDSCNISEIKEEESYSNKIHDEDSINSHRIKFNNETEESFLGGLESPQQKIRIAYEEIKIENVDNLNSYFTNRDNRESQFPTNKKSSNSTNREFVNNDQLPGNKKSTMSANKVELLPGNKKSSLSATIKDDQLPGNKRSTLSANKDKDRDKDDQLPSNKISTMSLNKDPIIINKASSNSTNTNKLQNEIFDVDNNFEIIYNNYNIQNQVQPTLEVIENSSNNLHDPNPNIKVSKLNLFQQAPNANEKYNHLDETHSTKKKLFGEYYNENADNSSKGSSRYKLKHYSNKTEITKTEPEKKQEKPQVLDKVDKDGKPIIRNINATILDFEELNIEEKLKYDLRGFFEYLWDVVCKDSIPLCIFFQKSLYYPTYIRILKCFTYIFFILVLNTVLYTDADISTRLKLDLSPAVSFINFITNFSVF